MTQLDSQSVQRSASLALVLGMMLAAAPSAASDEADALAVAKRCAAEVARVGSIAYVECMDPGALTDFKQLLMTLFERSPDSRSALLARMFGDTTRFEELSTLAPAELMKRTLQHREAAARRVKVSSTASEVVGAVKEGERVHVLVRERSGPLQPSGVGVTITVVQSYVKRDGKWRMELGGDAKQMQQNLKTLMDAAN